MGGKPEKKDQTTIELEERVKREKERWNQSSDILG